MNKIAKSAVSVANTKGRPRWLAPAAVVGAMLTAALASPGSAVAATTSYPLQNRILAGGCPSTMISSLNRGTAHLGIDTNGANYFRTLITLPAFVTGPLAKVSVSLVLDDPTVPQTCPRFRLGSFTASLLGGGSLGAYTPDGVLAAALPPVPSRTYDIWVLATDGADTSATPLVAGPLHCSMVKGTPAPGYDCPSYS